MLKELLESQFYIIFPKAENTVLMVKERQESGDFTIIDPKACARCKYICSDEPKDREQLKVSCFNPVSIVNMEQVFSYVQEDLGEVCDYMMETATSFVLVEMSCATTEYVENKRSKARGQLYNTLEKLFTCPSIKEHIENKTIHYVIFSWKETVPIGSEMDEVEKSMRDMTILADAVYSPDNELKFDFGFRLREIRYPYILNMS